MSDNNNGWPGEPGVPPKPQFRAWHWLYLYNGIPFPAYWDGYWLINGNRIQVADLNPQIKYWGECLTPAEVEARLADALKWRGAIDGLRTLRWNDPVRDHETPLRAVQRLLNSELTAMALDPAIHKAVKAEITQAKREALEEAARGMIEKYQSMVIRPNTPEAWRFAILQDLREMAGEKSEIITAAIRALSNTPPGMVLVPREPTSAMIHAGGYALQEHAALTMDAARIAWDAMVKAAEKGEDND
jgi:hypothetical protein